MQRTDNENIAVILQQLLKETRDLKQDNRKMREEMNQTRVAVDHEEDDKKASRRAPRCRRKLAPKECQVSHIFINHMNYTLKQ